jgi:hypothetical protein
VASGAIYHPGIAEEDNTSGWGYSKPAPERASGWSFAAAVPFGLFALYNGMHAWGVIGILLTVFGLWCGPLALPFVIGYVVYLGIKGRELAWRGRRFADTAQYEATMRVWNIVGAISLVIGPALALFWTIMILSSLNDMSGMMIDPGDSGCYTST